VEDNYNHGSLYRDRGVVLRTYKLGEADRVLVLVTAGHGKVRAVVKGIRRTKSRIGGRLEPLSHVDLLMYEGRELDIVNQAETIEPWRLLHEDLTCLAQGLAMAEATEPGRPGAGAIECPVPHCWSGRCALWPAKPGPLVVASFYWKLLSLDGAGPIIDCCASCGSSPPATPLVAFDIAEGGALCRTAGEATRSARRPWNC